MGRTEQIALEGLDLERPLRRKGDQVALLQKRHPFFLVAWRAMNVVLIVSVFVAVDCIAWEYSTGRYLKGFSDAVIPASAPPEAKIEAILSWMARGPARLQTSPISESRDRDPMDTLNYASLLRVCGSATNAFINLADSGGLSARRLLLVDRTRSAKHVVAEVLVGGRWIVVDPTYHAILRDADGNMLTHEQLADPAVFATATQGIPGYNPDYTYDRTAHVHLSRLAFIGPLLRRALDRFAPGWEDSAAISLLLERKSLGAMVLSILLVLFVCLSRELLRWYAGARLGIHPRRFLDRIGGACHAFLSPTI